MNTLTPQETLHFENLVEHLRANGIKEAILYDSYGEIDFSMI
jgi:hypothetical protein